MLSYTPYRYPGTPDLPPRLSRRSGQMVIFVTLSLFFLFSIMGLSVDLGYSYSVKIIAQAAADSAASAAAIYANNNGYTCGSGITCNSTYSCPSTLTTASTPLQAGCLYASANGFTNTGSQSVSLIANNTAAPNESGNSPALWIQANVSQTVPHLFLFWSGFQSGQVATEAVSGVTVTPNSGCVYVLDNGNTQNALNVSGNGSLSATSCGINVWSSNSKAADGSGNAVISASTIRIHGTGPGMSCSGNAVCASFTAGVAVPATTSTAYNPLVNLPAPSFTTTAAGCQYGTATTPYNITSTPALPISPGVYCGGITVSGGTLTFSSGVYILNGGGLSVSGAGGLSGANVMFFLTGLGVQSGKQKPMALSGNSAVSLTAPNSGPYQGVLFFQDPSATYTGQNTLSGNNTISGSGTFYFPNTTLSFSGNSAANSKFAFVVWDLTVSGNASITQDPSGIYTGLAGRNPGLIE